MMRLFRFVVWVLARLLVSLRYRLRLHGVGPLRSLKGPVLILPNHPGLIDPPLVLTALWPWLHPRPMLYEGNFESPILRPLMLLLDALRVPDLSQASAKARARAEQAVNEAIDALKHGQNIILWPSGRIQRDGVEIVGGARATADILAAVPNVTVVQVRTRGVWGSQFSFAPTRTFPELGRGLGRALLLLLASLVFFMPRRRVDITVRVVPPGQWPEARRETINPWLEAWYNAGVSPEPPTFVPYHFVFGPRNFEFPPGASTAQADLSRVTPETKAEVRQIVERKLHRPLAEAEQKPETTLDQLGLDSLDRMEVALDVEHRFGFSSDQVPLTLGDLWTLAQGLAERAEPRPAPPEWFRAPANAEPPLILGETVPEAFVARALACRRDIAAADDQGVVTYERLLTGALVLARRFTALPGTNVGLLLPASVASDAAFLGLQLAGKLPVVLNWTTGAVNLAHAAQTMGLTHVVSSNQFLDRLGVSIKGVECVCLEDLRKGIGKVEQVRTLLGVRWLPRRIRRQTPRPGADQPAVVLFTSGSEKAPKAVPLTHRNLLSNERACIPALGVTRQDAVLGFLPPFHSFGLSVTGLLPLLSGMRVVHHPDPTASAALARKIAAYRPTVLAATPTFLSYILDRAKPGQLASLRLIVVGAEKCPPTLGERCARAAPEACLLEGYGITECAPVVSVNRPRDNRSGTVGQPLPGVEICAVDLDTGLVLPSGRIGMLLVSGPTIFPGYVGYDGPSPFLERDGKRWYRTGDLAEIDADGYIKLSGRLNRFLKAGGEMISLPALEEPLAQRYPPSEEGPSVAVEGIELDNGRRIVLFTTERLELQEANAILYEAGLRGVLRLDEVRHIEKIPVLGTGKTDYKVLRQRVVETSQPVDGAAR